MANQYQSSNNRESSITGKGKEDALGQSEQFLEFQERLSRVAPIDRPVLILGERGTGKELAATRMHFLSRAFQNPEERLKFLSLILFLVLIDILLLVIRFFLNSGFLRLKELPVIQLHNSV